MPVPTQFTDLSTTAASNYPAGSDSPVVIDDTLRAHASFLRKLYDGGYLPSTYVINSTTVTYVAGSVGAPPITTAGDTNTGIWFPAADTVAVSTGGTERIRWTSGGVTKVTGGAYTTTVSVSFSATPAFDAALSNYFELGTMTANVTGPTISNGVGGQTIVIRVKQDATGGRTFAAPTGAKITGSVGPVASASSFLTLTYSTADSRWEGAWTAMPA